MKEQQRGKDKNSQSCQELFPPLSARTPVLHSSSSTPPLVRDHQGKSKHCRNVIIVLHQQHSPACLIDYRPRVLHGLESLHTDGFLFVCLLICVYVQLKYFSVLKFYMSYINGGCGHCHHSSSLPSPPSVLSAGSFLFSFLFIFQQLFFTLCILNNF